MTGRRLVLSVAVLAAACALLHSPDRAEAQVVDEWNQAWIDSIRATHNTPAPTARQGAILHASIQDAINSITRRHKPLKYITPEAVDADVSVTANAAAHRALTHLYPERKGIFDAQLESQLGGTPDNARRQRSLALGREVADAVIASRADDGAGETVEYTPTIEPGSYRSTPPDFNENSYDPHWPEVTPWVMNAAEQFRPGPPPDLSSERYAEAVNFTKEIGARDSETRTREQTEVAYFWANDREGTYLPIGHLNHVTQTVARDQDLSTPEQARLFALTNIAMADAGLVAWDAKYNYEMWRPVTAIREADTDGNPLTEADEDWLPLFPVTPPFPSYPSGHTTFAAAYGAVMEEYFGTDDVSFTITTDEPLYHALEDAPMWRTYDSFWELVHDNAMSRIFLGVHYDFDAEAAIESGDALGRYSFRTMAQPIPEPASGLLAIVGVGVLGALRRPSRRHASKA